MRAPAQGFTLLELLVVIAIVALATAGVGLALPDSQTRQLERESLRLSSLLEAARAQSRATGNPIVWKITANGFEFLGAQPSQGEDNLAMPRQWLAPETSARIDTPVNARELVLGPEPLIPAQAVTLSLSGQTTRLSTDGVRPFSAQETGDAGGMP